MKVGGCVCQCVCVGTRAVVEMRTRCSWEMQGEWRTWCKNCTHHCERGPCQRFPLRRQVQQAHVLISVASSRVYTMGAPSGQMQREIRRVVVEVTKVAQLSRRLEKMLPRSRILSYFAVTKNNNILMNQNKNRHFEGRET